MFQIDEKYSGKEKRKTIGYFKGREIERQNFRKKLHPVSRELDNYFCNLHKKAWWPNGTFIRKKCYYYAEPGLGYFYEKHNVEQLKDLRELKKETKKNKLKSFVEYNYIEDNQYTITIEYCSNCEEHKTHTFHREELYKNFALSLQKCIILRFPFIKVILKPIDTDILKNEKYKLPKVDDKGNLEQKYVNDKFKDVRIGAFEVQICFKKDGENKKTALLHSKLQSKQFPEISKILDKIVSYLTTFRGKIITYEKEEDKHENSKDNNNEELFKKGLLEGLQINIYLLNNAKIKRISNDAWNEIQTQNDPHKRQMMIKEQKIRQKESMYKNDSIINNNNKSRPSSSLTSLGRYHKSQSMRNLMRPSTSKLGDINNNINYNYNYNYNDSNIFSSSIMCKSSMNNYILDKNRSKSLKGKLILTKYTNSEGVIDIGPLPYDSYYIEVQESRQYRSIGFCLIFNTLNLKIKNYIQKYIGLFTQENSFIQLHVYEVNKDKNGVDDPIHLGKSKVTLKQISNNNSEENNDNNNYNLSSLKEGNIEKKFKINEKFNTPGIFEHTVPPGRYLLEVEKENYETIRKFIDLEKGFNSINVEMSIERCCNLHIFVYHYEKFQEELYIPIHNVDVIIYQNSNEVLEESITNNNGEVNYLVSKGEDFLTVVVSKLGYYPVQRIFIRNKEASVNENGEYEENLIFFLVKESFIIENNCILCVTYSSFSDINFDPNGIQISDNVKNRLNLSCFDGQKENGIISTFIKYQSRQEMIQNQNDADNNLYGNENQENGEQQIDNNNNNLQEVEEQQNPNDNQVNQDDNVVQNNINNNNTNKLNKVENAEDDATNRISDDENGESENYDNVITLSFIIQSDALKVHNYQDKGFTMNGLERYGCQTVIYMPKNMFYITAPGYCNEGYCFWNLGWLDVKNQLFYQTNTLTSSLDERTLHLSCWLEFLQAIIDNKIYLKLFEFFSFDKAILLNNDRYIDESIFVQCLKQLDFCKESESEMVQFIISLFKSANRMISFSLVKKKISSNLKNFSDEAIKERNFEDNNNFQETTSDKNMTMNNEYYEQNDNDNYNYEQNDNQ